MATRNRKNEKIYIAHRRNKTSDGCDFCKFRIGDDQVVAEHEYFWIVKNIFGYDLWDSLDVHEHLMIVPKEHIESIALLGADASREFMSVLADYEAKGYAFYGRPMKSVSKSVPHQHTHLLKLGSKRKKFFVFLQKPYLLWFK